MCDKHCIIEEPDEVKVSCPVLKTNGVGHSLVEFNYFYSDSNGNHEPNPRFLRKAETSIKHPQRRIYTKEKGKNQRRKVRARYARKHLKGRGEAFALFTYGLVQEFYTRMLRPYSNGMNSRKPGKKDGRSGWQEITIPRSSYEPGKGTKVN